MKNGTIKIGKFTQKDIILANKMASREMELENSTGWTANHRVHKSAKTFTRKSKHQVSF